MKNRCLARCNYSIRGFSVNLPNHSECLYSDEEVTGENDCDRTGGPAATSPITTYTMKCLLMDKCTVCTLYTAAHKLLQLQVSVMLWQSSSLSWHSNYLQYCPVHSECWMSQLCRGRLISCGPVNKRSRLEQNKIGTKEIPPAGNQHPHSADFQTNIMVTNFRPFGVCCFRLWQFRQKKPGKKRANMVLRVYSDHTICFLKSTFKTPLRAVPTALSLKLRLTSSSPSYYFPSV